jgi:hypothetical protein
VTRLRLHLVLLAAAAAPLAGALPARAQSQIPRPTERAALGAAIEAPLMADLPVSDTLAGLLETLEPSVITDRFSGAGLYQGQGVRLGSFAGSWTQTIYRIGDVDVTDPNGSGTPLVPFDVLAWQRLQTASGVTSADVNSLGLSVTLNPLTPAARWTRSVTAATSHGGLTGEGASVPYPAIARSRGWDRITVLASGPLSTGIGAAVGGSWTRAGQFDRRGTDLTGSTGQAFGHVVIDLAQRGALRLFGSVQRATSPFEHYRAFNDAGAETTDTTGHLQASWERPASGGRGAWRAWASYTHKQTSPDYDAGAGVTLERLVDGPVSALADVAEVSTRQWSAGGRLSTAGTGRFAGHAFEAGADVSGAHSRLDAFYQGRTLELVDGQAARWWEFSTPGESSRRLVRTAAFVSDRITLADRMVLDAALRVDAVTGRADGAPQNITWYSWLPRIGFRWQRAAPSRTALFASYGRSAYRLPLSLLAAGDPSSPTANLFRWDAGVPLSRGPLVARIGPGTGGAAAVTAIDGGLKRPIADEWTIGVDFTPLPRLDVRFAGIARHERHLMGLVNTGLTASAYRTFGIPDPGSDVGLPDDDRVITIYDRLPASFGLDRYLLTNPGDTATFAGLEWTMRYAVSRLALFWGATAGIAQAPAASRGFGPLENDQLLLGEAYSDPNAGTYARGRLFNDRAFTIKLAGVYRLPYDTTLGAIARYQDGQSFARVLVVPGLGQGTEAVRAFANGDSRFRFTGTLDLRVQKGVRLASQRVDLFVDVFNALDLEYEVEERAAAGPNIRTQTAVQPPRSIHVGARFTF